MATIGDESGIRPGSRNALMEMVTDDWSKEKDAARAARRAFIWGTDAGGPILGAVLAAGAFTAVMAFEKGTDSVPGVGTGDTVHAMLTPGEGVVPGGTMDKLNALARSGGLDAKSNGEQHYHAHFAPHVHAIDATGVDKMLTKHADTFHKHFAGQLRRMNR